MWTVCTVLGYNDIFRMGLIAHARRELSRTKKQANMRIHRVELSQTAAATDRGIKAV